MKFRLLSKILTLSVLLLAGCSEQERKGTSTSDGRGSSPGLSSSSGMMEYLENIPTIKNISRWDNPYGTGITITTAHYEIHTTLMDPLMLRQMPGFMEAAYDQYNLQLPAAIQTSTVFTTYLFADRSQWERFTRNFVGTQNAPTYLAIKKGAYYLNGACVAYNIGINTTFEVLGHEGWHQFNDKHFVYRLPSWLEEGIATLFETYEYKDGSFKFRPDRNANRLGSLKLCLADRSTVRLSELIVLNPSQVVHGEQGGTMSFYSQSYALVRFLREDGYGLRLKNYQRLLLDALYGRWPIDEQLASIASNRNIPLTVKWNSFISPKLFEYYFEQTPEQLEMEYRNFCNKLVYHVKVTGIR